MVKQSNRSGVRSWKTVSTTIFICIPIRDLALIDLSQQNDQPNNRSPADFCN